MPVAPNNRKPYKSKSVPYRNLITSSDPNARKLYYVMNAHPAREHIHIGPLWTTIYNEHKKGSINIVVARKTATLAVLRILDKIQMILDPVNFQPTELEVYI